MLRAREDAFVADAWTCLHFTPSNPRDDGAEDLPRLLRRVAEEVERRGITAVELLDVAVPSEITAAGPWWAVSVYWSPDGSDER